jgi:3-hydroxymyristoyl/3-hydroxydecanoyl-(acyl carrier protein) dehydratase
MSPFDAIDIAGILPQREPFVFVDRLVRYDDRRSRFRRSICWWRTDS